MFNHKIISNIRNMSDKTFFLFRKYIYLNIGINMTIESKRLLQARLHKRISDLKLDSYRQYYEYLTNSYNSKYEFTNMVNLATTNTTEFFREPKQFEFLKRKFLPTYLKYNNNSQIKIWSTACSNGAEPYTIAMILKEFQEKHSDFKFSIIGTDISTKVLKEAKNAMYKHNELNHIPNIYRNNFIKKNDMIQINPELRSFVKFKQLNLIDQIYDIYDLMDVIFCRNVTIYFDRQTRESVIRKVCHHLKIGGILFLGPSESIIGMKLPLKNIVGSIYQKIM